MSNETELAIEKAIEIAAENNDIHQASALAVLMSASKSPEDEKELSLILAGYVTVKVSQINGRIARQN